ncbi:hypothetical protein [Streptomyces sp. NPDC050528]|uniref:hypothetical protein n=1 Tax=Streptomyces sp. NPDC050528 TaxID=3365623 RepID=UPI0037AABD6D
MHDPQGGGATLGRFEDELGYGLVEFSPVETEYDVTVQSRHAGGPVRSGKAFGRAVQAEGDATRRHMNDRGASASWRWHPGRDG